MELQDYTTEELKSELKRRYELVKQEREKVNRCRKCKYWGTVDYCGKPFDGFGWSKHQLLYNARPCPMWKTKNGKYCRMHSPYQKACKFFESKEN